MNDHLRPPSPGRAGTAPRLLVILLGLLGFVLPAGAGAPAAAGAGSQPRPVVLAAGSAQAGVRTARAVRTTSRKALGRHTASRDRSASQATGAPAHHTPVQGAQAPGAAVLPSTAGCSAGCPAIGHPGPGRVTPAGAATGTPRGRAPPSSTGS